ncbi:molybdenum cofactor guanylyltransferase MobA [Ancylobacter lacus]|uniref:molybdenum cofactor guanylyltransferase MobA n=1 Tax=Ancylobacter lacus TaxID=2579970 RepID=UPI001BCE8A30|nr:molybdenum cofactor guanylyltransferase MobA [Ancylobacter lacus]MBS7539807.1 molybdenum cofactor guanylyltransferase MobA [Ancylobacter lacus]
MAAIAGVILAGGLSRRFGGGDKTVHQLGGRPILRRVIDRLSPGCAPLLLNANGDASRFGVGLAVVPDALPGHPGPLAGLLAAMDHLAVDSPDLEWLLSAPGDAPFLPPDLLTRLLAEKDDAPAACAASGGRLHPVVGLWHVSLRPLLRRLLVEEDERRAGRFAAAAGATRVAWEAQPYDPFLNINTPEDLASAEAVLAAYSGA